MTASQLYPCLPKLDLNNWKIIHGCQHDLYLFSRTLFFTDYLWFYSSLLWFNGIGWHFNSFGLVLESLTSLIPISFLVCSLMIFTPDPPSIITPLICSNFSSLWNPVLWLALDHLLLMTVFFFAYLWLWIKASQAGSDFLNWVHSRVNCSILWQTCRYTCLVSASPLLSKFLSKLSSWWPLLLLGFLQFSFLLTIALRISWFITLVTFVCWLFISSTRKNNWLALLFLWIFSLQ